MAIYICIELIYPLTMVIFHSYVSLPEAHFFHVFSGLSFPAVAMSLQKLGIFAKMLTTYIYVYHIWICLWWPWWMHQSIYIYIWYMYIHIYMICIYIYVYIYVYYRVDVHTKKTAHSCVYPRCQQHISTYLNGVSHVICSQMEGFSGRRLRTSSHFF